MDTHYTLHLTFMSLSISQSVSPCLSFALVYTATTVQPFHPWSVRKRRCRRPLSFGRTSGSRLLPSYSPCLLYITLQTGRGGERDKKPREIKNKIIYKTEVKNFLSIRVLDVLHEGEMTWTCESGQVTQASKERSKKRYIYI